MSSKGNFDVEYIYGFVWWGVCRQSRWRHSVPHLRWRICVTMATLWQQQDGCYILHLQQYSHRLNLLYLFSLPLKAHTVKLKILTRKFNLIFFWPYIITLTFQNANLVHNSYNLQQYICYTTLLNMFRAARCSSSGGPIVSPQPLVSSSSVSSSTVCRWKADCSPLSTCILYGCL